MSPAAARDDDRIELRRAVEDDLDRIERLRNDPDSVRYSKRGVLSRETVHRDFLSTPSKHTFIAELASQPLGYAALAEMDRLGSFEISIALEREHRGRGLATPLIIAATDIASAQLGASRVVADIAAENAASLRAFSAAGYQQTETTSPLVRMHFLFA